MNTRARAVTTAIIATLVLVIVRIIADAILGNDPDALAMKLIWPFAIASMVMVFGTLWVVFYKVNRKFLILGIFFPIISFAPFWAFSSALVQNLLTFVNENVALILVNSFFGIIIYFLILTVNILNGARLRDVPLGQAAKAVHFIFVLISSYLFFTFTFEGGLTIVLTLPLVFAYVTYMTWSSVSILELPEKEERSISLMIGLLTVFSFYLISIWPISSVYSTLIMTVILYLLLNVALEMREQITKYIIFEYMLLLILVVALLFVNSSWGVNGSII